MHPPYFQNVNIYLQLSPVNGSSFNDAKASFARMAHAML